MTWRALPRGGTRRPAVSSPNQAYREDLRELGEYRDCEKPLPASERNHSRCGVCRVKRKLKAAQSGGVYQGRLDDLRGQYQDARLERIRVLGRDDGAGSREAVRRLRAA